MAMLYLKSCPRCEGDVRYERDMYGSYLDCLQCGFSISSKNDGVEASAEGKSKVASGSEQAA